MVLPPVVRFAEAICSCRPRVVQLLSVTRNFGRHPTSVATCAVAIMSFLSQYVPTNLHDDLVVVDLSTKSAQFHLASSTFFCLCFYFMEMTRSRTGDYGKEEHDCDADYRNRWRIIIL